MRDELKCDENTIIIGKPFRTCFHHKLPKNVSCGQVKTEISTEPSMSIDGSENVNDISLSWPQSHQHFIGHCQFNKSYPILPVCNFCILIKFSRILIYKGLILWKQ